MATYGLAADCGPASLHHLSLAKVETTSRKASPRFARLFKDDVRSNSHSAGMSQNHDLGFV